MQPLGKTWRMISVNERFSVWQVRCPTSKIGPADRTFHETQSREWQIPQIGEVPAGQLSICWESIHYPWDNNRSTSQKPRERSIVWIWLSLHIFSFMVSSWPANRQRFLQLANERPRGIYDRFLFLLPFSHAEILSWLLLLSSRPLWMKSLQSSTNNQN